MFSNVRSSHIERTTQKSFVKSTQEEQLNKKLTIQYENLKKQA